MMETLTSQCLRLLDEVARECVEASQAQAAEGSVMAREMAEDERLGDPETFPFPYGFAHFVHRALVYSAGERLGTLWMGMDVDPPHVLCVHELARSAAESASIAVWLGQASADGTRGDMRLRRLLGLVQESNQYEDKLRKALTESGAELRGQDPSFASVLHWGKLQGVAPEPMPAFAELLRRTAPERGQVDYKRLSSFAHNTLWAVVSGVHEALCVRVM